MPKTRRPRGRARRTRRARRLRGGAEDRLREIINGTPMAPVIVNPESKFVVVTYWWGRGNLNKNTQRPCPEDISDPVKEEMEEILAEEDEEFRAAYEEAGRAGQAIKDARAAGRDVTAEQKRTFQDAITTKARIFNPWFALPTSRAEFQRRVAAATDKIRTNRQFCEPIKFEQMIANWESACRRYKCNYMAVEYPEFAKPGGYQLAINAKPMFIQKAIDSCEGRAVLYIDGDMFINAYPRIFDLPNVDFMARGWNIDPRSSRRYKSDVCFDPYIFETSGGTMYFASTPVGRRLLQEWADESGLPKSQGKADDRILSQVYTTRKYAWTSTTIQLPIEYLWLTDLMDYVGDDAKYEDAIIEHPECLTGEERATEQSVGASSREPEGYSEQISEQVICERDGGVFYEAVFFPTQEDVAAFGPYLKYLRTAKNFTTGNPLFKVVDFAEKYGEYNPIADRNEAEAVATVVSESAGQTAQLEGDATPGKILAYLKKGVNVSLRGGVEKPLAEFSATFTGGMHDEYHPNLQLDVAAPMFITASNPVIHHLFAMSDRMEDLNRHLRQSYVFMSRIRWSAPEPGTPPTEPTSAPAPASAPEAAPTPASAPAPAPAPASETTPAPAPAPASIRQGSISAPPGLLGRIQSAVAPALQNLAQSDAAKGVLADLQSSPSVPPALRNLARSETAKGVVRDLFRGKGRRTRRASKPGTRSK